ncbi:peroxiredoxin [Schlesneria sp. DSM 10557]|uniref:peroxiredoxin n=1 Tax=Schlesneria sp. DSM 10557 TaxID=3044399 RepID=UPI0035A07546
MKPINVGDVAPDFTVVASNGQTVRLSEFRGKQSVVLFFYPGDNTPICTKEACSFRDAYEDFLKLGAVVIAVSADSNETHQKFADEKKLPFLMIADQDNALRKLFGVSNVMFLFPRRITYLIDRDGIVRSKFNSQLSGTEHVTQALQTLREIAS